MVAPGGVGHHPDDELAVVVDGRVTSVAMDGVHIGVRGQLDLPRVGASGATVQMGYAQGGFPLLCSQEDEGQGGIGGPIRNTLPVRGRDEILCLCPHVSCDIVGQMDMPRL